VWPAEPVDVAQPATRYLALRRAVLPERRTGATLGDMHGFSDLLDTGAATRGA